VDLEESEEKAFILRGHRRRIDPIRLFCFMICLTGVRSLFE